MYKHLVLGLILLQLTGLEATQLVSVRGKMKCTVEELQANCDKNVVEYFRKVPNSNIFTFHVAKLTPEFTISIVVRTFQSQRVMYKLSNLNGCLFLNNPLISKALDKAYRDMLVNNTFFKCPILPKVYFIKGLFHPNVIPAMHPPGHFNITISMQTPQSVSKYVIELVLRYSVAYLK